LLGNPFFFANLDSRPLDSNLSYL